MGMGIAAGKAGMRLEERLDAVGHRTDTLIDGGKLVGLHGP